MEFPGVEIVIATAPVGLTLEEEIRLAKPALLYGDQVTLYSPVAVLLASAEEVAGLDDEGLIEFFRTVGPGLDPGFEAGLAYVEHLRRKRHRTKEELQLVLGFGRQLRQTAMELREAVGPLLESAGVPELAPAIDAGLLRIDPLVSEATDDLDAVVDAYVGKLRELLVNRSAHPLFDEGVGSLVRAGVNEGMFELGSAAGRRAKDVGVASELIARVPAFPEASVAEILDVREELRIPLGRFRSAVASFARQAAAAAHEQDFAAEIADLYVAEIEPSLQELREAIESNHYLRQLGRQAWTSVEDLLKTGGLLTIGMMGLTDASAVASVVVGTAAAAGQATVTAGRERSETQHALERDRLFFLYQAERALR